MDPPLTQDDSKRPRLEAEGAPGSPAASGPAGAATAAAAAGAAAVNATSAAAAVAAAAAPAVTPAAADGAPGGPLLLAELEDEEGDGWPEDGTALGEFIYGENTPKAGGSSRRGSAVPKGVWVFVKRIKHPGLRTRLLANGQIIQTHVCIKCLARLELGYVSTEKRLVTAAAVAHLRLHGGDETGEASKLKQIVKISSITLGMLGAGGMANYVVRAATCQAENISTFERRLRRTGRPDYRRQQGGEGGGRERERERWSGLRCPRYISEIAAEQKGAKRAPPQP
jgi:hypothetical protein